MTPPPTSAVTSRPAHAVPRSERRDAAGPVWPHGPALVGVVHDGYRAMVDTPVRSLDHRPATPAFRTTARRAALPWPSLDEGHVVLDTLRARALVSVPATAGDVPAIPGTQLRFDRIPGMRALDVRGYWATGASFNPHGTRVAVVEVHDDGCHLVLVDLQGGQRTYVSALPGVTDAGAPAWSPDGHWILAGDRSRTWLVGLREGALIALDLPSEAGSAMWWPQVGPSTLLALGGAPGAQRLVTLDLATGRLATVADVESVPVHGDDARPSVVSGPVMSPDGDRLLVGDTRGTTAAYQDTFGAARRLAVLDPRTGQVVPTAPAMVPGTTVERVHSRWSWSAPARPGAAVTPRRSFLARALPLDTAGRGREPRARTRSVWLWDAGGAARRGAEGQPARHTRA